MADLTTKESAPMDILNSDDVEAIIPGVVIAVTGYIWRSTDRQLYTIICQHIDADGKSRQTTFTSEDTGLTFARCHIIFEFIAGKGESRRKGVGLKGEKKIKV